MLPNDRLEWVEGWGMVVGAAGYAYRPATVDGVRVVREAAHRHLLAGRLGVNVD